MKSFVSNWKTSVAGLIMILGGVAGLFGIKVGTAPMTADQSIAAIVAGFGLLFAKEGNVTGGTTQQ